MIEVEIWSDIACPFCFIGKKNFEAALARFEKRDQVRVTWRSFELDPNAQKSQTAKIYEILARKYGRTVEWAQQTNRNLADQGKSIGIDFQFDQLVPTNTFDAHRLLHLAKQHDKQATVSEKLFLAYFSEGKDVALPKTLEDVANSSGLPEANVKALLQSNAYADEVRADEGQARAFSISGVPAFVFNREFLVSGAQPVDAFIQALNEASQAQT